MSTLKTNNIQHVDRSDPSIIINTDGSVNIAGTMTYEDVTNVDAVGIITGRSLINAQKQIHVGTGVSVKAGGINVTAGISTFGDDVNVNGGDLTISGSSAILHLIDENDNPNYRVQNIGGIFQIYDATSDAERLRVDSNGNIGVNGAATNISNQRGISIKGAGSNASGFVDFIDASGNSDGRIIADNGTITINADTSAATASSKIEFNVDNSNKITINASGSLLVATQSTTNIAANADDIIIGTHDSSTERGITLASTSAGGIRWNDGSDQGLIEYSHSDNSMRFSTSSSERLRIDSSGNVQIATTSGNEKLNVAGAIRSSGASANFSAGLEGTLVDFDTGNNLARLGHVNGASGSARPVVFLTGGVEKMRLNTDGGFRFSGQGTSIPVAGILHHTNNNLYVRGGTAGLILSNDDNTTTMQIYDGYIKFETTDGSERMRLTSTGRLGIGESTPLAQLHIKPPSNMSQLLLEQNNAADGYALFQDGPNGGHLKFLRHVGGSDTQTFLMRSGGGLCFGTDSAEANALDDYEEGTWTPECRIESRPASDSPIDGVQGNYEKIGKFVHAYGQFILNGTPSERSTSRAIELRNFPYSHGHNYDKVSGDIRVTNWLTSSTYGQDCYFVMRMLNGQTYARIELIQLGYNGTRNASVVMQDNMLVIFSFTYPAT